MNKACIIIPVYKKELSNNEYISLVQCLKILGKHEIILVTFKELDLSFYSDVFSKFGKSIIIREFNNKYFKDLNGYNRLTLSCSFYKSFSDFEYILIYQLDAYVFSDQLMMWCDKKYDYIGAPFYGSFSNKSKIDDFTLVGNGGFSLRRVKSFIKIYHGLNWYIKYCSAQIPAKNLFSNFKYLFAVVQAFCLKYDINIKIYNQIFEDIIWSRIFINKPNISEAALFSFEKKPSLLYKDTSSSLPFGCHAWEKYEYVSFWKLHIN